MDLKSNPNVSQTLASRLPGKVSFPGDEAYKASEDSYYVYQERVLRPTCVVAPTAVRDASEAIRILSEHRVEFAIRGGGHNLNAGWANIDDGVTLNLRQMNSVTLNADKSIAYIGGGATWVEVYRVLDSQGVIAPGGRVASVGVGGLSTGGGISFFSGRYGLVCDNIVNFQVILADGRVVDANEHENHDLWVALRGGSSNFGIVTRFDMRTFKQGEFLGGIVIYDISTIEGQLKGLVELDKHFDPYAAIIISPCYIQAQGSFMIFSNIEYTKEGESKPASLAGLLDLKPQMLNTMRMSRLADLTSEAEQYQPTGKRSIYCTTTFKSDLTFLQLVYRIWKDSVEEIKSVVGISWNLSLQPLPPAYSENTKKLGGNVLGLSPQDGPMILLLLSYTWDEDKATADLERAAKAFILRVEDAARKHGTSSRFKYLNYSASWQKPLEGYGEESMRELRKVGKKYDPKGFFQRRCPGGFKISHC